MTAADECPVCFSQLPTTPEGKHGTKLHALQETCDRWSRVSTLPREYRADRTWSCARGAGTLYVLCAVAESRVRVRVCRQLPGVWRREGREGVHAQCRPPTFSLWRRVTRVHRSFSAAALQLISSSRCRCEEGCLDASPRGAQFTDP